MRHIFLAFTNPAGQSEDPFNAWYDGSHVPEVLRYGNGFVGCRRYRLESGALAGGLSPWRYLALYDLEWDDLALLARKPFRADAPALTPFRGLVEEDHVGWVYTPRSPRVGLEGAVRTQDPPYADCLLLAWQAGPAPESAAWLRESVVQAKGCRAARAYALAPAQRTGQTNSPWQSLVIYETDRPDVRPPSAILEHAWAYEAVADYVTRQAA